MALVIPTTTPEMFSKIKLTLGGKNLNVELYEEEVEMAMTDGLILISVKRPVYKKAVLQLKPKVVEYLLEPDCLSVSTVYSSATSTVVDSSASPYNIWRRTTRNFLLGTNLDNYINYYQTASVVRFLAYINDTASILGMDLKFRRNGRKLQISPTPVKDETIIYEYNYVRDISELSPFELTWLYKYTLGRCKMIIGEKRRKFGSSLPLGIGDFKLNGSELFSEGLKEVEEALKELEKIQAPLLPLWGVGV